MSSSNKTTNITIKGGIFTISNIPNLDHRYGPYTSTLEAILRLGESGMDSISIGLTIGVLETPESEIIEYWWKCGTRPEDLIMKTDYERNKLKINVSGLNEYPDFNTIIE